MLWILVFIFVGAFLFTIAKKKTESTQSQPARRLKDIKQTQAAAAGNQELRLAEANAVRLGEIIRESLVIVERTKSVETRISRLGVAETKMQELSLLLDQYDITMHGNADRILLKAVEKHREQYNEYCFAATLQLRTPLAILLADGKKAYAPRNSPPPGPPEMWMGIWINKYMFGYLPTFREMGVDQDEIPPGTRASDIGSIQGDGYRDFLIDVRSCCEQEVSINDRVSGLYELSTIAKNKCYFDKLQGVESVIDSLFPLVVTTIPSVNKIAAAALLKAGIDTVEKISAASDAELLQLPSIGPKTLSAIRFWIDGFVGDAINSRIDSVIRINKSHEIARLKLM